MDKHRTIFVFVCETRNDMISASESTKEKLPDMELVVEHDYLLSYAVSDLWTNIIFMCDGLDLENFKVTDKVLIFNKTL